MNTHKTTPRDVYLHLLSIVTLFVSVISWIAVMFTIITYAIPDSLSYRGYGDVFQGMRVAISSIIVAWPIYLFISHAIGKQIKQEPETRDLAIRKWLTYVTLFVAAITIVIDLIVVINSFLSGELIWSFALKIVTVLVAAAAVFWYHTWDLKRTAAESVTSTPKISAYVATIVILATLIGSFIVMGSPATQRAYRFDEQRVSDLQQTQYQIFNYYQQKETLPQTADELQNDVTGFTIPADPETGERYEYKTESETSFSLCATFARPSRVARVPAKPIMPGMDNNQWEHDAGHYCFTRTIDQDFLKSQNAAGLMEPIIIR